MFAMEITRLIERCRQGDADALGELYKAYAPKMRGVCRRYISNEQTVDDVLHDAFVIIFTSFDKLRDASKAEGWMMAITRNVASKYKKHLDSLPFVPLKEAESLAASDEKIGVRGVPLEDVLRMVERLPEGYGQVFRLSVFDGMSHKEIAAMLGIEPHSSSSQLVRAKRMLRSMIQRYWAVLLLLLVPVALLLLNHRTKDEKPVIAEQKDTPKQEEQTEVEHEHGPEPEHLPERRIPIVHDVQPQPIAYADSVAPIDTLSNMIAEQELADTTQTMPTKTQTPRYDFTDLVPDIPTKKVKEDDWQLALAYAGTPSPDIRRTDDFMTMPDYFDVDTRSTKIYNWGDYMDYVSNNASMMDSVSAANMERVLIINADHPSEPISETKHHERPFTLQLSLSKQLNKHWSLSTGLGYTRMKSTFESGNENTLIRRSQQLHYLGIPLKLNYRILGGNTLSLYTSGGVQLDLPVSGNLTTQYIYSGPYAPIGNSPDIITDINAR